MFKIIPQEKINTYTLTRYTYDEFSNANVRMWTVDNLSPQGLTRMMYGRTDEELSTYKDFVVLKSGPIPCIIVADGEPSRWN